MWQCSTAAALVGERERERHRDKRGRDHRGEGGRDGGRREGCDRGNLSV